MRPTVEDLQAIWLFTYSRSSLGYATEFLAELDKVVPESVQYRALVDAAITAYMRPFTRCKLPLKKEMVIPLENVLPPEHLAQFHEHAKNTRDTMIGHTDATPVKGYTASPNRVLVGNFAGRFSLTSMMIGELDAVFRNALGNLCVHFMKHCDANLRRLRKHYRSEFDMYPPGEYELVIAEPPADWLIPWQTKHSDDYREPGWKSA